MFPAAGKRDRRVKIEQRSATDAVDSSYTPVETWTTLSDNIWAEKVEMSGIERFRASQLTVPHNTTWRIGYRADMDPELIDVPKLRRLVYQSRTEDIVRAELIDRRHGIELQTLRP